MKQWKGKYHKNQAEIIEIKSKSKSKKAKSDLLEALERFSDAPTYLRQLFGAENKGGDAGNNH